MLTLDRYGLKLAKLDANAVNALCLIKIRNYPLVFYYKLFIYFYTNITNLTVFIDISLTI